MDETDKASSSTSHTPSAMVSASPSSPNDVLLELEGNCVVSFGEAIIDSVERG